MFAKSTVRSLQKENYEDSLVTNILFYLSVYATGILFLKFLQHYLETLFIRMIMTTVSKKADFSHRQQKR